MRICKEHEKKRNRDRNIEKGKIEKVERRR
jgi:hypothetical protein